MSGHSSRRGRRGGHGGGHEGGDERWLLTYADMITLLMALFMVLFSISSVNISKYQVLQRALQKAFMGGVLDGGKSFQQGEPTRIQGVQSSTASQQVDSSFQIMSHNLIGRVAPTSRPTDAQRKKAAEEQSNLDPVEGAVLPQLHGFSGLIKTSIDQRGLVIRLLTDKALRLRPCRSHQGDRHADHARGLAPARDGRSLEPDPGRGQHRQRADLEPHVPVEIATRRCCPSTSTTAWTRAASRWPATPTIDPNDTPAGGASTAESTWWSSVTPTPSPKEPQRHQGSSRSSFPALLSAPVGPTNGGGSAKSGPAKVVGDLLPLLLDFTINLDGGHDGKVSVALDDDAASQRRSKVVSSSLKENAVVRSMTPPASRPTKRSAAREASDTDPQDLQTKTDGHRRGRPAGRRSATRPPDSPPRWPSSR